MLGFDAVQGDFPWAPTMAASCQGSEVCFFVLQVVCNGVMMGL